MMMARSGLSPEKARTKANSPIRAVMLLSRMRLTKATPMSRAPPRIISGTANSPARPGVKVPTRYNVANSRSD